MAKEKEKQETIKKMLIQLEKSTDKREKQKIRAKLRSLGHRGGLNRSKGKAPKKKTAKKK